MVEWFPGISSCALSLNDAMEWRVPGALRQAFRSVQRAQQNKYYWSVYGFKGASVFPFSVSGGQFEVMALNSSLSLMLSKKLSFDTNSMNLGSYSFSVLRLSRALDLLPCML